MRPVIILLFLFCMHSVCAQYPIDHLNVKNGQVVDINKRPTDAQAENLSGKPEWVIEKTAFVDSNYSEISKKVSRHAQFDIRGNVSREEIYHNNILSRNVSRVMDYAYDAFGRETHIVLYYLDTNRIQDEYIFAYYPDGKLASCVDLRDSNKQVYQFDTLGRETVNEYSFSHEPKTRYETSYQYDSNGRIMQILSKNVRSGDAYVDTTSFSYDEKGNCLEFDSSLKFRYKYDSRWRRVEWIKFSSDMRIENVFKVKYDDHDNRTEEADYGSDNRPNNVIKTQYVYDKHGNWIKRTALKHSIPICITEREISYYE